MALLDIIQRACSGLKLPKPQAVATMVDPQLRQLLELANVECEEVSQRHDWSVLKRDGTFTVASLASGVASFAWPADFLRMTVDGSFSLAGARGRVHGPVSSRDWQDLTDGVAGVTGAYWRPYAAGIQVYGAQVGEAIRFDYVSKFPITDADGTAELEGFEKDTDRPLLPERMVRLGVIWRWRRTKGADYAEELADYERELERVTSADGGFGSVMTAGDCDSPGLSFPTITIQAS